MFVFAVISFGASCINLRVSPVKQVQFVSDGITKLAIKKSFFSFSKFIYLSSSI